MPFYKLIKREGLNKYGFKSKAEAVIQPIDYQENYYNIKRINSSFGYQNPDEVLIPKKLTYLLVHKNLAFHILDTFLIECLIIKYCHLKSLHKFSVI